MEIADVERVCESASRILRGSRADDRGDARTGSRAVALAGIRVLPGISIVVPIYNEEAVLPALFERLYPALDALGASYEVIFINDGSRDRSGALLREQFRKRPDVTRVILFNGNFGSTWRSWPASSTAGAGVSSPSTPTCRTRRGDRAAARENGRGLRLRRHHPARAPGLVLPAPRLATHESHARAYLPTSA
jgi:cellulose synthase/poly-beta-1,6-N-acetylglucosamine synthase-like glycosyltransferase